MSRDLKLTLPAVEDFEGILEYTLITWSEFQYKKYRDLLLQALAAITADPGRIPSKVREDLGRGIWLYPVGRHYLVYGYSDAQMIVFRILHQQMDLPRHLDDLEQC